MKFQVPSTLPLHYRAAITAARPFLSWVVALGTYRDLYRQTRLARGETFCGRALATLDIGVDVSRTDLLSVTHSGPLIVVANHPHGMLDGLALGHVIERHRRDVRILTSQLLAQWPELEGLCLFVDPFDRRMASPGSRTGLRAAVRWLTDGHALIVFPSGTVAHNFAGDGQRLIDPPWHNTVARLARRTGALVVPAFIDGRNSDWFYRAGRIHPLLRTLLLPRQLLRQRGTRVTVRLGPPVLFNEERRAAAPARDIARLRRAVDGLATRVDGLHREVETLDTQCRLCANGTFEVFYARAAQIPSLLEEIGRLREITFRAVGEGTGHVIDLDEFDKHYFHLFAWNRDRREVVGAYRLGLTDEIVASHGVKGLYTSTLFRYDSRLLDRLSPAVELGRSFVREEYQRSTNALLLLWKGIAAFVSRLQRYRVLFGPVSISSRYGDSSQQLLKSFLAQNHYRRDLSELVEALTPPADRPLPIGIRPEVITNVSALDKVIARLEGDGKGIPVLLRQYLRLNAKLLGFNVDPAFGNALDALMMVDLLDVDRAILNRYFGKEGAAMLLMRFAPRKAA